MGSPIYIFSDGLVFQSIDSWIFKWLLPFILSLVSTIVGGLIVLFLASRHINWREHEIAKKEYEEMIGLGAVGIADVREETDGSLSLLYVDKVVKSVRKPVLRKEIKKFVRDFLRIRGD